MLQKLAKKIQAAQSIVLTTHRECDGDGLGAQIALFHGLKKIGKKVRVLNVDPTPKKYLFLSTDSIVEAFEGRHQPLAKTDLCLIFDTNDSRLIEPLFTELQKNCGEVLFIDHHPVLLKGPAPTAGSWIDIQAASTGEIAYQLLKILGIDLDAEIARALYTSVAFDTQLFRYVRRSASSHLMAADLLSYEKDPEEVHRRLFSNYTVQKVAFLSRALGQVEYLASGRIAVLRLHSQDLLEHALDLDESRDVIDLIMNVASLEAAALFREDGPNTYKMSLRSKGQFEVLSIAESLGGGGHPYSSGAFLRGSYDLLRERVVSQLLGRVGASTKPPVPVKKNESA
jgi:phosphoesterase RecJ-like protein